MSTARLLILAGLLAGGLIALLVVPDEDGTSPPDPAPTQTDATPAPAGPTDPPTDADDLTRTDPYVPLEDYTAPHDLTQPGEVDLVADELAERYRAAVAAGAGPDSGLRSLLAAECGCDWLVTDRDPVESRRVEAAASVIAATGRSATLHLTLTLHGVADAADGTATTTVTVEVAQGRPDGPWLIVATATST